MRSVFKGGLCLLTAFAVSAASADIIVDNSVLTDADIQSFVVTNDNGNTTISIVTTTGDWVLQQADGTTEPPPPDPEPPTGPASTSLSVSPSVVEIGQTATFTWSTQNAVSCSTRKGNAEWQAYDLSPITAGSKSIVMDALGEDILFRINCVGSDGVSSVSGARVTVVEQAAPDTTSNCPSPQVANGLVVDWQDFWQRPFPDQEVFSEIVTLPRWDYHSIRFNTGSQPGGGGVRTVMYIGAGNRNVSVSECPGVFTDSVVPASCFQRQATGDTLYYGTDGTLDCSLAPNKTYYINTTYVDVHDEASSTTSCGGASCSFKIESLYDLN